MDSTKKPEELRSHRWFGVDSMRGFGHRSRTYEMGYTREDFAGKPVIGIINTWSETNTCHSHMRQRAEEVKRGVWQAGGFPVELPAMSVGEQMTKPTSMMYRNFLAMETEELLRSQPIDGCVLMGGCDKTTPGLLMGALSMDLPAIYVPAGAMLRGHWRGETLGSGTDVFRYWAERRAGKLDEASWFEIEQGIARSPGTCMTMGTAATMMSLAETLGMTLPGASSIPAVDATHSHMASRSGRRIVDMVWEDMKPSGKFLMEDFYYAGGLPALLRKIGDLLVLDCPTVNGRTLGQNIENADVFDDDVIRSRNNPLSPTGGTAVLRGNLAPNGAIIKPTAAEPHLLDHTGPAVVFENIDDLYARIDDDDLQVTADSVLVLKNAGPQGGPGMPEWGQLPIPKKLLEQGVRDMVRISDCRMSGTSYGACVLHVAPEAAVGGPLALLRDGDVVTLDVEGRRIDVDLTDEELAARKLEWTPPPRAYARGYGALYLDHVTQANEGCDFDFLHHGEATPEPKIY